MRVTHSLLLKAAGALLALTTAAAAQDYPAKPVRIIVPFPPGAINDFVGRTVATHLSNRLGKQVVVENRAGAGGVVGTELVVNAPNDGHTLLVVSLAATVNPWLYKLPYDQSKAFAPIAVVATAPNVIAVHPDVPAKTAKDLIALAKKQPGKLQYASSGIGTFLHLGPELFKTMAGVDILHIPYKGAAPAMVDVIGGRAQMVAASIPSTLAHLRSGKLRAIGIGATKRNGLLPDVPTISESGLPGYEAANWIGIVAPAGTPAPIVAKLHKEISLMQETPEVQKQFTNQGADIMRMSSAEFAKFIASETAKWGRVVKEAGIKAQ
ncbi:MAG: tripartite tricarboxylate transporter substrate binding protein [Rhizobiales bacterium]|nr:tripartite tricarboxylate transporter substrate binding protein [Hyphomicrobiales bacterium]